MTIRTTAGITAEVVNDPSFGMSYFFTARIYAIYDK
jgi:hypothetical protein